MSEQNVVEAVQKVLASIPPHVILVAAAKGRTVAEVRAAISAGVTHVGHNYVQEAAPMVSAVPEPVQWHMIGHLQTNKVKTASAIFHMIETVDSARLADELNRRCTMLGKTLPVLVEINSGAESSKSGVLPQDLEGLLVHLSALSHVQVQGLMTLGPRFGDPESARPFFRITRSAFERFAATRIPNVEMRYLSMGMSNSYRVAIEEGANIVRLGTVLFGERA